LVNKYIRNAKYSISSSDDFLTQAHHGWYGVITGVQTAAIELAMGENTKVLYTALKGITGFPIDQAVYADAKKLMNPVQEKYVYDDTVPYVWNDISTIGTKIPREAFTSTWSPVNADMDDGGTGPIAMGMSFDFYDASFDNIHIGINGICSLTDHIDWITTTGYGTTIPGMGWDNILCPLACDIMGEKAYTSAPYNKATGNIYYYYNSAAGTFTIQYHHMTNHMYVIDEACPDTTLTFQIVLDSNDGSITYYYKDLGTAPEPTAKRATIGIQPGKDSGLGVQYYGGNLPANGYPVTGDAIKFYQPAVAIKNVTTNRPTVYSLAQNFPNPFNPTTSISFTLPIRSKVSLVVYDMLGRNVANLVNNQFIESGYHRFQWDASHLPSGIYFYRLEVVGQSSMTKKCILMK
ncbi:MAG: T9SS type A sorting domain-containing protein, partial [archaeon]